MDLFIQRVKNFLTTLPDRISFVATTAKQVLRSRLLWTAVLLLVWTAFGFAVILFYNKTGLIPTNASGAKAFQVFLENELSTYF